MVFLVDLLTYPHKKRFSKKSFLKIFIILFEQDCPEAVVHGLAYYLHYQFKSILRIEKKDKIQKPAFTMI